MAKEQSGDFYSVGKYSALTDAIAIAHAIVANAVILAGVFTEMFFFMAKKYQDSGDPIALFAKSYPGIMFVYDYIDLPVYSLLSGTALGNPRNSVYSYGIAELVILLSSLLYSFIVYLTVTIFGKLSQK